MKTLLKILQKAFNDEKSSNDERAALLAARNVVGAVFVSLLLVGLIARVILENF